MKENGRRFIAVSSSLAYGASVSSESLELEKLVHVDIL